MTALDMNRPALCGETEDETTGAVLVVRIVLDDPAASEGLADLSYAETSQDRLVNGML